MLQLTVASAQSLSKRVNRWVLALPRGPMSAGLAAITRSGVVMSTRGALMQAATVTSQKESASGSLAQMRSGHMSAMFVRMKTAECSKHRAHRAVMMVMTIMRC
mmetsp:Transcript_7254/g.9926  ORF Transcript_7254/g.9926 Transcript_7254/m.9926 type:complete len:104 (-) Transcript_7254:63-374(-)